jgi:tetratricopeptide (TPR) repeat protein
MVKLCLNMIVKNESKIIERLLNSVLPIIDSICICDTGSSDNTIEIIENFMKNHNLPGIVFSEPFQNFGYNRTLALERATTYGDYLLLLDADMKLIISPDFNKEKLTSEAYEIIQQNNEMKYYNTRIIKTGIGIKCIGSTHEYYDIPKEAKLLKLNTLNIEDIGDGGSKETKYIRDIELLTKDIQENPNNSRSYFYLGYSYKNIGRFVEAIENFQKRITYGGWPEEVFLSMNEIGVCYRELGNFHEAVHYFLEAYNYRPSRAESIYELVYHYRITGKHVLAQHFCTLGKTIPYPKDDILFIRSSIYDFLFDYEQTVLYFFVKQPINYKIFFNVLNYNFIPQNVLRNYKFYTPILLGPRGAKEFKDSKKYVFNDTFVNEVDTFTSSSPCIVYDKALDLYKMNIRYVNYTIQPNGTYTFIKNDGKIRTVNKLVYLDKNFKQTKTIFLKEDINNELRYQGLEDLRLFKYKKDLYFTGVKDNGENKLCISHGILNEVKDNKLEDSILDSPYGRDCEKNWVLFTDFDNELKVIYEWYPFTVGKIESKDLSLDSKDFNVPGFFRQLRGSTNGWKYDDELWFLCHIVYHEESPREYYHIMIILDSKTLKLKRHSKIFKFEGESIEYALGLVVKGNNIIISYSIWDRTSNVVILEKDKVEKYMF